MAEIKAMTWAEQQRERFAKVREKVLLHTGISTEEMNELVYAMGSLYATIALPHDEKGVSILTASSDYWNWFANQWNIQDELWICNRLNGDETDSLVLVGLEGIATIQSADKRVTRADYEELHRPENMRVRPGKEVWDDVTIHRIVKQKRAEMEVNQ